MDYVKVFSLGTALALISAGSATAAQDALWNGKDRKPVVHKLRCSGGGASDRWVISPTDVTIGPVTFGSAGRAGTYSRRHFKPWRELGFFPLKSPMKVDAGQRVRIEVAPINRGHAALTYGVRNRGGADVLDIVSCSAKDHTAWVGFMRVDGPQCVRLRVIHRGTTSILRLPFGRGICGRAADANL